MTIKQIDKMVQEMQEEMQEEIDREILYTIRTALLSQSQSSYIKRIYTKRFGD